MAQQTTRFAVIKISATGNDFLLVDLLDKAAQEIWQKDFGKTSRADLTRQWCDRHEGLGADGLVVLEPDSKFDFTWDFYNSDGGPAEMCGNAARAVSLYFARKTGQAKLSFGSKAGEVNAIVYSAADIEVSLPPVSEEQWSQTLNWSKGSLHFDFIRAGVPHAVLKVPTLDSRAALRELAEAVKEQPRFAREGVNVTFVHAVSDTKVNSVTFERGVEDFTRACGTGAIAAAYSIGRGEEARATEVQVPGGLLSVIWKNGRPHLRGPAKIVAEMRVIKEA